MDFVYVMGDQTLEAWDAMLAEDKWENDLQLSDATQKRIEQAEPQRGGAAFNIADHLEVVPDGERHSPKYKLTFKQFKVLTRDLENVPLQEVPGMIMSILAYVLDMVLLEAPGESYVRLRIENAVLRYPIWTPAILKHKLPSKDGWTWSRRCFSPGRLSISEQASRWRYTTRRSQAADACEMFRSFCTRS